MNKKDNFVPEYDPNCYHRFGNLTILEIETNSNLKNCFSEYVIIKTLLEKCIKY